MRRKNKMAECGEEFDEADEESNGFLAFPYNTTFIDPHLVRFGEMFSYSEKENPREIYITLQEYFAESHTLWVYK